MLILTYIPLIVNVQPEVSGLEGFDKEMIWQVISTPSLIGNTAIVRTDDKLPVTVLVSVTVISLSWLRGSVGDLLATSHIRASPIPLQVKLTLSSFNETVTDWGGEVITKRI